MKLEEEVLSKPLPKHIAIILDGNGRWAKKRLLPRSLGHRAGALNLKDTAVLCQNLGIEVLTVFCFSTENWNRPKDEVDYLMQEPVKELSKNMDKIVKSNIKFLHIGRCDRFPKPTLDIINELIDKTKNNTGLKLVIAADYGSRYEISEAVKKISKKVKDGLIDIDDITPELIDDSMYTAGLPKLDLLIRTSGEIRISNFLLWQLAYAELYFTNTYWPDFKKKDLLKAIDSFQSRDRRYGKIKEENK